MAGAVHTMPPRDLSLGGNQRTRKGRGRSSVRGGCCGKWTRAGRATRPNAFSAPIKHTSSARKNSEGASGKITKRGVQVPPARKTQHATFMLSMQNMASSGHRTPSACICSTLLCCCVRPCSSLTVSLPPALCAAAAAFDCKSDVQSGRPQKPGPACCPGRGPTIQRCRAR